MLFKKTEKTGSLLVVVGGIIPPLRMNITAHAESLRGWRQLLVKSETQLKRTGGGFLGRLSSGFPLITPAEYTRRKAKPQGGILIKTSSFCGTNIRLFIFRRLQL